MLEGVDMLEVQEKVVDMLEGFTNIVGNVDLE